MAIFLYLLLVLTFFCSVLWVWLRWSNRHLVREVSNLPTLLPYLPVLGSVHCLLFGLENATRRGLGNLKCALRRGEDTFAVWMGPFCTLVVCGEEDVQKVLTSSAALEKADVYDYMKLVFGEGLLTAPGNIWKITRRHLEPLFHTRHLENMTPILNDNCRHLVNSLARITGHEAINILDYLHEFSLKNSLHLILGCDLELDTNSKEFISLSVELKKVHSKANELIMNRYFLRSPIKDEFLVVNKIVKHTTGWVQEVQLKHSQLDVDKSFDEAYNENKPDIKHQRVLNIPAVFTRLQETYPTFTDNALKSEIATFLMAGTESVNLSISLFLLCLAKQQDVQEHVYDEIVSTLGQEGDLILQDVSKLTYLDQVYKESLRWASIFPYVGRKTSEDITLSKCKVPAGSSIIVSLYGLHYNPKTFPDPEKFDPERFSSEKSKQRGRYSCLPFAGGPRSCIGKRLANFTVLMVVVHLLRRFKITTEMNVNNLRRKLLISLSIPGGVFLTLHERF